ncbi:MAG: hypothetical protein RSH52_04070 [Janthinobacterium sp.]
MHKKLTGLALGAALALTGTAQAAKAVPTPSSNEAATARHFAALLAGAQPKTAELSLFFSMMPKGGDLHHHYSGAIYAEQFLDWVDKENYCVNKTTYRIESNKDVVAAERAKPAAQRGCLSSTEVFADAGLYAELLQRWSTKDFYNHGAIQTPPDRTFFDTFGYFGPVASSNTADGLKTLKQRAIAENLSYIETIFELSPFVQNTQFDQQVLSSVKLHAEVKVRGEPESVQTLDFQADGAQRKVSFSGEAGSLDLKVDASALNTLGSKEKQAKALGSYMKQFDQAASRGHGDAGLVAMLKDSFTALHSNTAAPQVATDSPETGKWRLAAEDKSIMTGLADFSASVSQAVKFSNPMRSSEKDGFNYEVSQKTSQTGASQDARSLRQQQQSKLSASFHETLVPGVPLRLTAATESQNYTYHQIEDTASSDAQVAYKDGKMVKASLRQEGNQSEHVMKYFLGKLESDKTTPGN